MDRIFQLLSNCPGGNTSCVNTRVPQHVHFTCTLYIVHCTMHIVHVKCTLYMYIVHCTLYNVHCTCKMYIVHVAFTVHCIIECNMYHTGFTYGGNCMAQCRSWLCIIIVGFGVLLSYDPCTQAGHLGVNQVELA